MNKMNKFFLMGTIALSGMTGLTACSSDDDVNGENGNSGQVENGVVKTQFAINVPKAAGTRMSAETAQDKNNFRGLTDITLYPLTITTSNVEGTTLGKQITLKGDFKKSDYISGTTEHKLYADVDVPIGTNHFLLYAQALENKATSASSVTDMAAYGVLNANGLTSTQNSVSNINFNLQSVKTGKFSSEFPYVLQALNNVVNLDAWVKTEKTIVRYAKLRSSLQSLNVGSATAIFNTMQSLCVQLGPWASAGTDGRNEQTARDIIAAVKDNFVVSDDVTYTVTAFKEQTLADGNKSVPEATFPTTTDGGVTYTLPEGVANINYTDGKFQQVADPIIGAGKNQLSVSSLTYPSALYYFDDTTLKASNNAKQSGDLPATAALWKTGFTDGEWYDAVAATTRTIVLKDNINYGVALLKVTAKCSSSTLAQNDVKGTDGTTTHATVDVPSNGFPVTAVLVGGQPDKVDWEFLPTGITNATAATFNNTVYDNTIPAGIAAKASTASDPNYTILLDNRKVDVKSTPSSTNAQNDVYLVLELENKSGVDFNGANGIVKKDAKFYVVGTVSPYIDVANSNYSLKNWNGDASVTNPSIFMRDYVTTLNVSINTLAKAYNTIPDLRPTNLALGMSVDLEWQKGFTTDVVIE